MILKPALTAELVKTIVDQTLLPRRGWGLGLDYIPSIVRPRGSENIFLMLKKLIILDVLGDKKLLAVVMNDSSSCQHPEGTTSGGLLTMHCSTYQQQQWTELSGFVEQPMSFALSTGY